VRFASVALPSLAPTLCFCATPYYNKPTQEGLSSTIAPCRSVKCADLFLVTACRAALRQHRASGYVV